MSNKKKMTITFVVLAIVAVFAVLVFSGVIKLGNKSLFGEETTVDPEAVSYDANAYVADVASSGESDAPYLPTGITDIFYTMTKDGAVSFFKYTGSGFEAVKATGTYDVTVTMSEENVSATVTYYKDGSSIAGYGLYTGKNGEYNLYPYAFFCMTGYGEKYNGASDESCYLLVDTTADDFYSENKIYEEPFIFTFSSKTASRQLSEANRTVGLDGTKRADYSMINSAAIKGSWDRQLFFSGRQYGEEDPRVDLMTSGGSGNNTDNVNIAQNVLCYWATYVSGGIEYLSYDSNGNVALIKYVLEDSSTETIKTFEGVTADDILVSDGYFYFTNKNSVYSLKNNEEVTLKYTGQGKFKADMFVPNGETMLLRGYINERYPAGVSAQMSSGSVNDVYINEMFRNIVNPVFASDGHVILTAVNGEKFNYYVF